jgi:hypothetical protein
MKRLALVALLAAMFFGVAASVSAGELKVRAGMDVYAQFSQNLMDFNGDNSDPDNNVLAQRARMYFDYISNENLKMVVGFEMDQDWGVGANPGFYASDRTGQVELKHAYLDFTLPETAVNVKAGLFTVALPGVFGSPIFDEDAHAIVVSAPINDMFAVSAGYMRLLDWNRDHRDRARADLAPFNGSDVNGDEFDAAFLAAPITLDGFSVTPYFAYAWLGSDYVSWDVTAAQNGIKTVPQAQDSTVYWVGANAALTMFDPFTFEADLIYGASDNDNSTLESKGWFGAIAASYKMDMVTPKVFFTYGSGNDDDPADGNEAMPTVREGFGFSPNTGSRAFSTSYDSWAETPMGIALDGTQMWSVGLQLLDISFVEKLSHEFTIAYMKGTSEFDLTGNNQNQAFSDEDSAWEMHFVTKYQIFEELAALAEFGYLDASMEDRRGVTTNDDASSFMAVGFQYRF